MCVSVFVCVLVFASFVPCVCISASLPLLSVCRSVCIHTCQSASPCVSIPVSLSVRVYPYLSVCLSCLSDFCVYVWLKGEF